MRFGCIERIDRDTGASPQGGGSTNSFLMLATDGAYGRLGRPATYYVYQQGFLGVSPHGPKLPGSFLGASRASPAFLLSLAM